MRERPVTQNRMVIYLSDNVRPRREHLLRLLVPTRHAILHDGDAANKAMLRAAAQRSACRVPLLLRPTLVIGQNALDDGDEPL